MYKRVPSGFAADHPHAELLRLKDVTFGREIANDEVFSADLPVVLAEDFAAAVPVMRFLASSGRVATQTPPRPARSSPG
jgi:hypothetical protein